MEPIYLVDIMCSEESLDDVEQVEPILKRQLATKFTLPSRY